MRLKKLKVRAFRGYGQEQTFDLDSPVVLLTGPNGRGKTSFFDAIQWALLGKLPRLTGSRDSQGTDFIGNAFAVSTEPFVELVLGHDAEELVIQRSGHHAQLRVKWGNRNAEGSAAGLLLQEVLLRQSMTEDTLYQHLTRTHLLEQETLLDFLRSDRPTDRFRMLSRFLGLSAITDKARFLQEAVNLCSTQVTVAANRLKMAQDRANDVRRKLQDTLELAPQVAEPREHQDLFKQCRSVVDELQRLTAKQIPLPEDFASIPVTCKIASTSLEASIHGWHSARVALTELSERTKDWQVLVQEQEEMQAELEQAKAADLALAPQLTEAKEALARVTSALDELRKRIRDSSNSQAHFAHFLQDGKQLAAGRDCCPLCGRPISYTQLVAHIEKEMADLSGHARDLAEEQERAENAWKDCKEKHDGLIKRRDVENRRISDSLARISGSALKQLMAELERWGVRTDDPKTFEERISAKLTELTANLQQASRLQETLERLANAADAISRSELIKVYERDSERAEKEAEAERQEHLRLSGARDRLQLLQRRVQGVERDLVEELLQRYEPVWQEFYYRVQPHPLFTRLRLKLSQGDERGVFFEVVPEGGGNSKRANMIFSGGQSAGLMVVLFLTLHLHQNWTRLETVMLDDPLQTMDDVNVLGLVDLLRFFSAGRQLVLSTHDDRFANMLLHKFRSLEPGRPIVQYSFDGLTRMGPVVRKEVSSPTRVAREAMYLPRQTSNG